MMCLLRSWSNETDAGYAPCELGIMISDGIAPRIVSDVLRDTKNPFLYVTCQGLLRSEYH
jgi:hypothetical protein